MIRSNPAELVGRYVSLRGGDVHHDPDRPGLWVALPGSLPTYLDPKALEARARAWLEAGICDEEGNPQPNPYRRPRPATPRPLLLARLPWPPSANRLWRQARGRLHLSREARDWRERARGALRVRWHGEPLEGPVLVHLVAVPPDRRKRDLDNLAKAVLDALEGVVLVDDSQAARLILDRSEPHPPGHVLVRVFAYRRPWR